MLVKATATHPVCLSTGCLLAAGGTSDVDPDLEVENLTNGLLTPVQGTPKTTRKPATEEH